MVRTLECESMGDVQNCANSRQPATWVESG